MRLSLALLPLLFVFSFALFGNLDAEERTVLPGVVVGVVDGDTADVRLASGMIRIRMHAIDAPETGQPYGRNSKQALSSLVFGKAVQVEP